MHLLFADNVVQSLASWVRLNLVQQIANVAWMSFDLQEHKIHNNASLVMEHIRAWLQETALTWHCLTNIRVCTKQTMEDTGPFQKYRSKWIWSVLFPKIYMISASLAAFFFIFANVFLSISSEADISLKFFWNIMVSSMFATKVFYLTGFQFIFKGQQIDVATHQFLIVRDAGYEIGQLIVVYHPRSDLVSF